MRFTLTAAFGAGGLRLFERDLVRSHSARDSATSPPQREGAGLLGIEPHLAFDLAARRWRLAVARRGGLDNLVRIGEERRQRRGAVLELEVVDQRILERFKEASGQLLMGGMVEVGA